MNDNEKLYAVIAANLDMLVEEFDCGDINMEQFTDKVERMFGNTPVSHVSPRMGLEWDIVSDEVRTLYFATAGHCATLNIYSRDGNKYVSGNIEHTDREVTDDDDGDDGDEDPVPVAAVPAGVVFRLLNPAEMAKADGGCEDPECVNCSPALEHVRELLKPDPTAIPWRTLVSFGPLKRDEN